MTKINLFGKTFNEISDIITGMSLPAYTTKQISEWLYKKFVKSIDEMTNLSKAARLKLEENHTVTLVPPVNVLQSNDGTKKYLFATENSKYIESAYIPEKNRKTLCLSSQAGCKMGCIFCMTGKQGFQGNLSAGEILNQIVSIPEKNEISNLVYMGMGEPFDNLDEVLKSLEILTSDYGFAMSPRRITVSTVGLIPELKTFLEKSECHLAVSLHTPFEEERKKLMPIQSVYSLNEIINLLKQSKVSNQRRISFEYILFKNFNDSLSHINELARILNGIKCRINLIRFHKIPGSPFESPDEKTINEFKDKLSKKGIITTIRASRGQDISAACGLLSTKELLKN